jgi:hypothetical protein
MRTEHDIHAALLTLMPDPDTDAAMIAAVHRKIARRRTATRATVVATATATAAAGIAASLVLAATPPTSHVPGTNRHNVSAPVELRTLSEVAAIQPAFRLPGPGQFFYTEKGLSGGTCLKPINHRQPDTFEDNCAINILIFLREQSWIAANGSGRVLTTTISHRFVSPRDRAHWIAAGRPNLNVSNSDLRYRKHELTLLDPGLGKLPTDPVKLAKAIVKWDGGPPGAAEQFTRVGDLLRLPDASPKLRAAAFEVGARIPGIKSLGTVTFHGVTGAAIAFTSKWPPPQPPFYKGSYIRRELIFDRASSTLKAEVTDVIRAGKIISFDWKTYLASGLVNSTHSTPGH